ncbi:hypothetical protein A2382_03855 [Candidatus Woesebacteria bacterium RIFOXYB1_FULL_38_16]|uniref:Uncharacterized protein n=1 Tax=Candidatus Woesebacteria bacterium RIFOXYB1_FULL_38_16 TaxID=1802538 RepID=A0A1F8CVY9_9BACT|nr:MAG: hypothetical protein A2191_03560 [Candidatus Woesebacteria bacterium RIFOXYA1_FULL_38_9]OGM80246.1 MAG: hypothetical protein A2382_03855 [Candidatus Woesebacteria bacterium RIFOXYB1_FULL_38_16]
MAKTKHTLEATPLMMLSMLTIFMMMPTLFSIANQKNKIDTGLAAEKELTPQTATPMPTEKPETQKVRIYQ